MENHYIYSISDKSIREKGGNKAKNLRFLIHHDFRVPSGFVVSWDALRDYQNVGEGVINKLRLELSKLIKSEYSYAVRSSASAEDDCQYSYAGIFKSVLMVKGINSILESIKYVWQSLESDDFVQYQKNNMFECIPVKMAVIIQEMVPAVYSGVAFSKNPMTGLSETIIEAGFGNANQQQIEKTSPERWISKWNCWTKRPEPNNIREQLALSIVKQTGIIAKKYKQPVDLEWAYDGQTLYFLQVRPITKLDIPVYSNRISREMLPGIIKPLVWSVNTRLINQTWVDILKKITGDNYFKAENLTGHFYYRAYFNMSVFGRVFERLGMPYESLELLLGIESGGCEMPHMRPGIGILPRLPGLFVFLCQFILIEMQFNSITKSKKENYRLISDKIKLSMSSSKWLELINMIHDETKSVAYFNIVIPMMAMMYNRLLGSLLKKYGYDIRSIELSGFKEAAEQNSPHIVLERLRNKYFSQGDTVPSDMEIMLERDLEKFIEQFGHFSDSGNDFSSIPWNETPQIIRKMVMQPVFDHSSNSPHLKFEDLEFPWISRGLIRMLYRLTSRFAVHRETISSLYTYGYGQFRKVFIGFGSHLVNLNLIKENTDIFFIYWDELIDMINHHQKSNWKELVQERKNDIEKYRNIILPDMIFGSKQPPANNEYRNSIKGIPTSLGSYTGPARVLDSISDFERLNRGDVLIIPYSDVGWTPLFSKAGAVISESGGILSHSSIIAREYHIPAVVSVSGACRIKDGAIVTVNGFTGDISSDESLF